MRHVMVDIETLGTKPGSVILSIGACRFDDRGLGERFYQVIDVFDSLMNGLVIDTNTVEWWRQQSDAARSVVFGGRSLSTVLIEFDQYLSGAPLVWAKGPDFDLVLLEAAYAAIGRPKPWHYRAARDVRTLLALAPSVADPGTAMVPHHALRDAELQALAVQAAVLKLGVTLLEVA